MDGTPPISPGEIHNMNSTLLHRGPDDEGIHVAPGIGLGHRRLSIIDLRGGRQPISNEDETVWVLLNGEIYNFPELRSQLTRSGHRFKTCSDTETIVHLYEEKGEECFSHLRGMFAIAIWDSRKRRLLLARDRVGKKPLFYGTIGQRFVFGSELKALLALSDFPREVEPQALSDYWSLGYIPSPKTIYRVAHKLRPGHYMVVQRTGIREICYWNLSFQSCDDRNEADWSERIICALEEATRVRLISDVPLGAFLSGGLDSSSVVAMMARISSSAIKTCSITFKEDNYDEAKFARQVARQFATEHFEHAVEAKATEVMEKLAWHFDEPFADSSAIPTYYLSKVARERVSVALGGDGGDENFAGYDRYYFDGIDNRLRRILPPPFRVHVLGRLGHIYPSLAWAPRIFRAKYRLQSIARDALGGYFHSISYFRPEEKLQLLSGDFVASLHGYDSISVLEEHYQAADTDDQLSRIQYVDMKTNLPDDILVKLDRASMAVSLEVRAPLLDHRFIEMAASIPSSLKVVGSCSKYIFKKALEPILSHKTLHRRKQGFAVPLREWFQKDLHALAYDALFSSDDDVLNRKYLRKIWDQHQSRRVDRSACLWSVLMYLNWKKVFQH
jgi:asparagine synthase (glutamine-hydrolysing)